MLKDFLTGTLEISDDIEFDRVHRLNGKTDSPVIAKCTFYKDKLRLLKQKPKLKELNSNIFIGEDFSPRIRDVRKKLSVFLKEKKRAKCRASMVFDHLIVDGKKYGLDASDNLVEYR